MWKSTWTEHHCLWTTLNYYFILWKNIQGDNPFALSPLPLLPSNSPDVVSLCIILFKQLYKNRNIIQHNYRSNFLKYLYRHRLQHQARNVRLLRFTNRYLMVINSQFRLHNQGGGRNGRIIESAPEDICESYQK